MNSRSVSSIVLLLAVLAGCSGDDEAATDSTVVTLPDSLPVTAPARPAGLVVPLCDELPDPADSLDWSGVQRADFPDPLRTRGALLAAFEFPFTVDVWGGTGTREGWIVVGVAGGAVELQAILDSQHPGARVLAMPLDWTFTELSGLAALTDAATADLSPPGSSFVSMSRGVVRVELGEITAERVRVLSEFADDPVCIIGDPG